MERAISEFGRRLRGGGIELFHYAGHGIQVGGDNYLLPGDDAEGEAGRFPWLHRVMSGTASRHSGFACLFTISTPFSYLASA